MNGWLWTATILAGALIPLAIVAARCPPLEGLVALEVAGTDAALVLLLLSEGIHSQSFADLALVLGVMSFIGAIAFVRFLERLD